MAVLAVGCGSAVATPSALLLSPTPARQSPAAARPLDVGVFYASLATAPAAVAAVAVVAAFGRSVRVARRQRRCQSRRFAIITRGGIDPDDVGDALIPQQPIGRLVTKGDIGALEYDPADGPEFICDEHGSGNFSWMPLTPEGGLFGQGGYMEQRMPVPADRLEYLTGAGWLQAAKGEDYRAYVDDDAMADDGDGRAYRLVILRGSHEGVRSGSLRLMAGVLKRRPWDPLA